MQGHKFSPYEYLSFIFPGLTLGATVVYGWRGWPYGDPGLATFLALVSAAFIVGHLVTAVANWVEPLYWGEKPGGRVPSAQGLAGDGCLYDDEEWQRIEETFARLHSRLSSFENRFRVEYSMALKGDLGDRLQTFVDQIGFYRAMATASAGSVFVVTAYTISGRVHMPLIIWGPIFLFAAVAFAARYKRFWTRLGDYVVREAMIRSEDQTTSD